MGLALSVQGLSAQEAVHRLIEGNHRYVTGQLQHPHRTQERREATLNQQHPFAVIVGCSDSRVAPEIVFDQGIGDIFNARVAGNIVNEDILGSLEFACKLAGSKVIVIMGHTSCGAVKGCMTLSKSFMKSSETTSGVLYGMT